jgi:hypothetical protein
MLLDLRLMVAVESLRAGFKAELEASAALPIGNREKSPLAKTVRTANLPHYKFFH